MSQHQANAELEQVAIASEIELAATDVARDRLVAITSQVYDEADVGSTDLRRDIVGLTPAAAFGPDASETAPSLYDDLDDYHNFLDTVSVAWHGSSLEFAVTAEIRYVNPNEPDISSPSPSLAKEIAVRVTEIRQTEAMRPQVVAKLVHVITPAWTTMQG